MVPKGTNVLDGLKHKSLEMKDFEAKAGNDIKSSILSSPAHRTAGTLEKSGVSAF